MIESERAASAPFAGGGEAGALMRSIDWQRTPLGAVEWWPQSLLTTLDIMLTSPFPMFLWWGPEHIQFYNDGYRPSLGNTKHPRAMGQRGEECWAEIWPIIGPMIDRVMERGEPSWHEDQLIPVDRNGFMEEVFWTYSYSPVRAEDGTVGGTLVVVNETTQRVQAERRLRTLHDLAAVTANATDAEQACELAAFVLGQNPADVPFALVYLTDADAGIARLAAATRLTSDDPAHAYQVDFQAPDGQGVSAWPLADALRAGQFQSIDNLVERIGRLPGGVWQEPPTSAAIVPIGRPAHPGVAPPGVLIVGRSPRIPRSAAYDEFFQLAASQLASAIAHATAYAAEHRRGELLAELDRAKTTFFSNISHEFRTPLTLLLGPSEELLADTDEPLTAHQRERQELIQRNAVRLLKLVNTLLEFSRIEAGRATANFQALDLATFTAELSASFRSAIERAGLLLSVSCPPLPPGVDVYVDPDMWERVVLNLLSNALKFTFEGSIGVSMHCAEDRVELIVSDTGTGIASDELPHLFERFHRIEGARARTHEGSGIGLALAHELVRLHAGTISVTSAIGCGTAFKVSLPIGAAHLPADRIARPPSPGRPIANARTFVQEALGWLPDRRLESIGRTQESDSQTSLHPPQHRPRILWVDDNSDLRAYVARLLSEHYDVETVGDGPAALAAARTNPPDLVLSDVMLPGMDGLSLLQTLRDERATAQIPVLLLSARSGDEARIEGLQSGADDYLVKPFSARELVARVDAHLLLARLRSQATHQVELERARLHELLMQAPAAICLLNGPDHVYTVINRRFSELIGGRDVKGKSVREAFPELAGQDIVAQLDHVFLTGITYVGEQALTQLDRDGDGIPEDLYFTFTLAPFRGADGAPEGIFVLAYEVTEQVIARIKAAELAAQREQAVVLARNAAERLAVQSQMLARLEERERIAMELHDGAIQRLYGVVLGLGARQLVGSMPKEEIDGVIERINAVIQEIRNFVLDLRLEDLEHGQLRAGIEALADEVRINTLIRPHLEIVGNTEAVAATVSRHVLQIVREATSNVIRHSGATNVAIRLTCDHGRLIVAVQDNGRGFDRAAAGWLAGNGLRNIAERARRLAGRASVSSRMGHGTRIRVTIPIEQH